MYCGWSGSTSIVVDLAGDAERVSDDCACSGGAAPSRSARASALSRHYGPRYAAVPARHARRVAEGEADATNCSYRCRRLLPSNTAIKHFSAITSRYLVGPMSNPQCSRASQLVNGMPPLRGACVEHLQVPHLATNPVSNIRLSQRRKLGRTHGTDGAKSTGMHRDRSERGAQTNHTTSPLRRHTTMKPSSAPNPRGACT